MVDLLYLLCSCALLNENMHETKFMPVFKGEWYLFTDYSCFPQSPFFRANHRLYTPGLDENRAYGSAG